MELTKFYDIVEDHPDLEGHSINAETNELIVEHLPTGRKFALHVDGLLALESGQVSDLVYVLLGERDPVVLNHVTRVVGYFSRVSNWNASKVGELRDRQKGNYAVEPHKPFNIESAATTTTTTCTS